MNNQNSNQDALVPQFFDFLRHSPSCFHAVEEVKTILLENGFVPILETENWKLSPGGKYYLTRNSSSIIAFKIPAEPFKSFSIIASHSDSPTFKIKENAELEIKDQYVQLNTERYGGMICPSWMDRPLSVAGRILVREDGVIKTKLVNIDRDLVLIPNLAIHMNREINDGYKYNAQVDMLPLFGTGDSKGTFLQTVASSVGVTKESILGNDLFLYNRMNPTVWGADNEFISAPKLDDLECAFSSVMALLGGESKASVQMCCIFDNEEVGSGTKQGADSTMLYDTLRRICISLDKSEEDYYTSVASSFMLSADNAHATHPSHPAKADSTNQVFMNKGVVIKFNANQKYTTDGVSNAIFRSVCDDAKVPYQFFANRSDMVGGSTLGNISNSHVSLNTIDIGLAQLAMHSSYETAGAKDLKYMVEAMSAFLIS